MCVDTLYSPCSCTGALAWLRNSKLKSYDAIIMNNDKVHKCLFSVASQLSLKNGTSITIGTHQSIIAFAMCCVHICQIAMPFQQVAPVRGAWSNFVFECAQFSCTLQDSVLVFARFRPQNNKELSSGGEMKVNFCSEETITCQNEENTEHSEWFCCKRWYWSWTSCSAY